MFSLVNLSSHSNYVPFKCVSNLCGVISIILFNPSEIKFKYLCNSYFIRVTFVHIDSLPHIFLTIKNFYCNIMNKGNVCFTRVQQKNAYVSCAINIYVL